jgi:alkaline phosphatase D
MRTSIGRTDSGDVDTVDFNISDSALIAFAVLADDGSSGDEGDSRPISPLPFDATAFPDGISSGDVTQTTAVLWARASKPGLVSFQISNEAGFHHVISAWQVSVVDSLVPAKVEVNGLNPDHRYYYRAIDADGHVAEGTFETAAKLGQHKGLTFGVFADSRGELARPIPRLRMRRLPVSIC